MNNTDNISNRMNYVLIFVLSIIALAMLWQMMYAQQHGAMTDASVPHILDLIVGGFLAMINPFAKHLALAISNSKTTPDTSASDTEETT